MDADTQGGLASALLLDKVMMKLTSKQRRRTRRAYDFSKMFPLLTALYNF